MRTSAYSCLTRASSCDYASAISSWRFESMERKITRLWTKQHQLKDFFYISISTMTVISSQSSSQVSFSCRNEYLCPLEGIVNDPTTPHDEPPSRHHQRRTTINSIKKQEDHMKVGKRWVSCDAGFASAVHWKSERFSRLLPERI